MNKKIQISTDGERWYDLPENGVWAKYYGNKPLDSNWAPIESAPKDYTNILGLCFYHEKPIMAVVHWSDYYWSLSVPGAFAEDGEWNPEYWMPLPPV